MEHSVLNKIVEIAVGLLLVAVHIPVALTTLAASHSGMTNASVDPVVITLVIVMVPILAIIGLALYFIPKWK